MTSLTDLVWVGGMLAAGGYVTSHGGNLSVRDGDVIRITRTRAMLGRLGPADIVVAPLAADADTPPARDASSDLVVHQAIYAAAPAVEAIVHAHPVTSAALSLALGAGEFQPVDLEGRLHLGAVPIVGGPHLDAAGAAEPVARAIGDGNRLVLLGGHGTYAAAATLEEGLNWTSSCEASARMVRDARLFGWTP